MRFTIMAGRTIWLILLGLLCIPGLAVLWEWAQWRHCTIDLPSDCGQLIVSKRAASLVFAEYDYFVRHKAGRDSGPKHRLKVHPPERSGPATVLWYPASGKSGPFVLLKGMDWNYLVDLHGDAIFEVCTCDDTEYLGQVISGDAVWITRGPGVRTFPDGRKAPIAGGPVKCNGELAQKFVDRVGDRAGRFLGSLDGQRMTFTPAK